MSDLLVEDRSGRLIAGNAAERLLALRTLTQKGEVVVGKGIAEWIKFVLPSARINDYPSGYQVTFLADAVKATEKDDIDAAFDFITGSSLAIIRCRAYTREEFRVEVEKERENGKRRKTGGE